MLEFARWKYILVAAVLLLALVFALPNFFGEDMALQIARKDRTAIDAAGQQSIEAVLQEDGVPYKSAFIDNGRVMVLFDGTVNQLRGRDAVGGKLANDYVSAMARASRAPNAFRSIGLRPMPLGLDLRGGLYLLYEVDLNGAISQLIGSYEQDFRRALSAKNLTFSDVVPVTDDNGAAVGVRVLFPEGTDLSAARAAMQAVAVDLSMDTGDGAVRYVEARLTSVQLLERQRNAIQQNIVTLRNRVGELGVSEPIVQQQGADRIVVQLPGVQNSAEVKDILGKVATLEFRLTDTQNSVQEAVARGRAPLGSRLYYHRERNGVRQPTLLKRELIATGDQLIDATSTVGQDGPAVSIRLNAQAGDEMLRITQANVGRPMAVVLIEQATEKSTVDGQVVERKVTTQDVISEATIRGVFGNQFNITGLTQGEARDLALLMRSGQLAAPLSIVNERVIGPSLGEASIKAGVTALIIGMAALFIFMIIYYHLFGVVASMVLMANVVLLTALLSMMKASLSLPGIAGILLTVGMAVDANVIIYERIREELRAGMTPQAAIRAGFEKAFSAILDSNVTAALAGLMLWVFGTGPIRSFAIVLTLGIGTSMFTALLGSRALLTLIYGGRKKPARLAIG
ncbi:MAG: protein translocase subunit SecD [Nevskiaceae bacterium]|jgi:preprotein translocase subunit SecD|nr:protein translocase subunit SecD [Nevskiaceae bacterium]